MRAQFTVAAIIVLALGAPISAQEVSTPKKVTISLRDSARQAGLGWFGLGLDCPECDGDSSAGDAPGAVVTHVARGGPADRAKLTIGDTLLAIGGKPMTSRALRAALSAAPLGGTLKVLVGRSRGRVTVDLTKREGKIERINGEIFTVRYRSEYGDVAIDVLSPDSPVIRRDSTGTMMIRVGDSIIRLRRDGANAGKPPSR